MYQFDKLEKNICDFVKEQQIKLGFRSESIRLYYPLSSLNRFLNLELSVEEMQEVLKCFAAQSESYLGNTQISHNKDRFCICLAAKASEYIHETTPSGGFLYDLVELVATHGTTMDQVLGVFYRYSDSVHVEQMNNGEFDTLVYFEDGIPDDYRYCLKNEGHHLIYHRFTVEDYNDNFNML